MLIRNNTDGPWEKRYGVVSRKHNTLLPRNDATGIIGSSFSRRIQSRRPE